MQNKFLELAKNTMIITIGRISTQFISFLLLPLYTTFLSTSDYGLVDLLNTLVSLVVPIITLQIDQSVFRHLIEYRKNDNKKMQAISSSLFLIISVSIIFCTIYIIIRPFVSNIYKDFLAINIILAVFLNYFQQTARGLGKTTVYAVGNFLSSIVVIILNVLFITYFKMGAKGMLLSSVIGNIIAIVFFIINIHIYKCFSIKSIKVREIKSQLSYSLPLIPNSISWWIVNTSDRLVVSSFIGISANGILSVAHKFPGIYIMLYNIFNLSWTESSAKYIDEVDSNKFFYSVINSLFNIFSGMAIMLCAIMPFIFDLFINDKFREAYYQIPILTLASLFNVIVGLYSVIYVAKKLTKEVMKTSIYSGLINIGVNLLLVKFIGIYASSISTLIAYIIMAIYRYVDVKKYLNVPLERINVLVTFVLFTITFFTYYVNNDILNLITLIIDIIVLFYINKEHLNDLITNIKGNLGENNG